MYSKHLVLSEVVERTRSKNFSFPASRNGAAGVPSTWAVVSESDPVGSLVFVYDAVESSKNNENVSGNEPPAGAWVVMST